MFLRICFKLCILELNSTVSNLVVFLVLKKGWLCTNLERGYILKYISREYKCLLKKNR